MSLQSLMLISQYKLPIKIIVLNNKSLGMIVQFQDLYFDSLCIATTKGGGYLVPDIENIAKAYSLDYTNISDLSKSSDRAKLSRHLKSAKPEIIEIDTKGKTTVVPKLEVNKPVEDMLPSLKREELKQDMLIDIIE